MIRLLTLECVRFILIEESQVEDLIESYMGRPGSVEERKVVYAYMALGGFLWTLWAVYKSSFGEEFGDYTLIMYRYAKRYYEKVKKM